MRSWVMVATIAGLTACGSQDNSPGAPASSSNVASAAPKAPTAVLSFHGSFDAAQNRLEMVYRSPAGDVIDSASLSVTASQLTPQEVAHQRSPDALPTLPWGTGPNQVYIHTEGVMLNSSNCFIQPGVAVWSEVIPMNGYSTEVDDLTAVMDYISQTGGSFYTYNGFANRETGSYVAPPTSTDYGTVPANGPGDWGYFEICVPSLENFTFDGHMEGTVL